MTYSNTCNFALFTSRSWNIELMLKQKRRRLFSRSSFHIRVQWMGAAGAGTHRQHLTPQLCQGIKQKNIGTKTQDFLHDAVGASRKTYNRWTKPSICVHKLLCSCMCLYLSQLFCYWPKVNVYNASFRTFWGICKLYRLWIRRVHILGSTYKVNCTLIYVQVGLGSLEAINTVWSVPASG